MITGLAGFTAFLMEIKKKKEIVTNERYVIMLWKVVTSHGKNMSLKRGS